MMSSNPFNHSIKRRTLLEAGLALGALKFAGPAVSHATAAQKKYGPGASDSQIKIGNIMPYSGPLSAYAVIGKTEAAFFQMINDRGRYQRSQDQLRFVRRRIQSAEDVRAGSKAGRGRRRTADF